MRQLLVTLRVTLSLSLVSLGGSDLTRWLLPSNPEFWQIPQQSWDPFLIHLPYPMMYRAHHMRSQMMHKIIFTVPFYLTCGAKLLSLLGCYTVGL
jgi:hypothetical protein